MRLRTIGAALVAAALPVLGLAVGASPAAAVGETTGTVSFHGDQGDYITGGGSYAYTSPGDTIRMSGTSGGVSISIDGANGDWWYLDFAAPSGSELAVGTYAATRYPFNDAGAGFDLSGNGRGCNTLTATFTINRIAFENGGVTDLAATFEQHCEGWEAAAYGQVDLQAAPPPAPLQLGVANDSTGQASSVDGRAYVTGTLTCSRTASVDVSATVTQATTKTLVSGSASVQVECSQGRSVAWRLAVTSGGGVPFRVGDAKVEATAGAYDESRGDWASAADTDVIRLKKSSAIS